MKKITAIVFCIMCMILFVGCDGTAQTVTVPDGMQIVRQSKEDGYVFFAPEAWTVANQGDISAVYLSAINPTSITFVKAEPPTGAVAEYFESTMKDFPYKDSIKLSENSGERTNFGNADKAYKYVYSYKYGTYDIACMQVLIQHGGKFFIFTYTSYGDITDENSYYRMYLDRAQAAIDNFLDSPIFGKGFYGLDVTTDFSYGGLPLQAHNTFLQLMSATGAVGLVCYLCYRFYTLKPVFKRPSLRKTFMALSVVTLLLGSMLDNFVFFIYPTFHYTVALAVIHKAAREEEAL